jgi:NTP pyrophosphatase (non-canonical NTP hydrolase)
MVENLTDAERAELKRCADAMRDIHPFRHPNVSYFDDVGYFHAKFELPLAYAFVGTDRYGGERRWPAFPPLAEMNYRIKFMQEELEEFAKAYLQQNLHDAADALADLVWVALGTAHHLGLPFEAIWAEVMRANMEKEVGPPDPTHKRPGERIHKPDGWRAPDHRAALGINKDV